MSAFVVKVRASGLAIRFNAIGPDSASVHIAALDHFGACAITVLPYRKGAAQ